MPLCYGGGIVSSEMAVDIIKLGFEKVLIGRSAVTDPEFLIDLVQRVGSQSVAVSIDILENPEGVYSVMLENATKTYRTDICKLCMDLEKAGAGELCINSINREGSMKGYDTKLAKLIYESTSVPVIINGGCGSVAHMQEVIDSVGNIGIGVGTFFQFKGRLRAPMITYSKPY
jgi:cyclase